MSDVNEKKQLEKIQAMKTISDQQDALWEIAVNTTPSQKKDRVFNEEKTDGELFYLNTLGVKVDFTDVKIMPKPQIGRDLIPVFVDKRVTLDKIILRNKTECIIRINPVIRLETMMSPYSSNKTYMVWVINDLRPDLRLMNQRDTHGKRIMTVEERVLFGLKRFQNAAEEQNKYMDLETPTLTSSYAEIKNVAKAIIVKHQNGGMYIDIQNRNTPGGAREVFGVE